MKCIGFSLGYGYVLVYFNLVFIVVFYIYVCFVIYWFCYIKNFEIYCFVFYVVDWLYYFLVFFLIYMLVGNCFICMNYKVCLELIFKRVSIFVCYNEKGEFIKLCDVLMINK